MYKFLIFILFATFLLSSNFVVYAQQPDYKQVDEKTYQQFMAGEWQNLADYGENAYEEGLDYFYLNLRVGIAFYQLRNYEKALDFLKRAYEQNPDDPYLQDYYYGALAQTGQEYEMGNLWEKSDALKAYPSPTRFMESFSFEGGVKNSTYSNDSIGALGFFGIAFRHGLSKNVKVFHSYSFLQQQNYWGQYRQHQYFVAPQFYLGKGLTLTPAFQFVLTDVFKLDDRSVRTEVRNELFVLPPRPNQPNNSISVPTTLRTDIDKTTKGTLRQIPIFSFIELRQTQGKFRWAAHASAIVTFHQQSAVSVETRRIERRQQINPQNNPIIENRTETKTFVSNVDSVSLQVQAGADLSLVLGNFAVGANVFLPFYESEIHYAVSPYIWWGFATGWALNVSAYQGNALNVIEQSGSFFNNSPDLLKNRMSLVLQKQLTPTLSMYLNYQFDSRTEGFVFRDYQFHSGFAGIKIML